MSNEDSDGVNSASPDNLEFSAALQRLARNPASFATWARLVVDDLDQLLAKIRTAIEEGAARDLQLAAHNLRGLCAIAGAKRAMKVAHEIELAATDHQLGTARQSCNELSSLVDEFKQALLAKVAT